jgi:cupin fold WbuC family metalloprotein
MARLDSFRRVEGKTLAFFAIDPIQFVDAGVLQELKALDCNARICLHTDPSELFHDMIILEKIGSYFPTHRHQGKAETIHVIEGILQISMFDNECNLTRRIRLDTKKNSLIWRIPVGHWHLITPLTSYVIYHESKPGPFLGEADREFFKFTDGADRPQGSQKAWV